MILSGILLLIASAAVPSSWANEKPVLKIAVACDGETLEAQVVKKGPRGQYLQFFDKKGDLLEVCENPYWEQVGGAGVNCADFIAEKGATVFVAGMVGSKMEGILDKNQITFKSFQGTVNEAVAFVLDSLRRFATNWLKSRHFL
jgi:predicted Fe-Mo cluster-binding NifX family protein